MRPAAPLLENIPQELRDRPQWVVWALEQRGNKLTKIPYTPGTTKKAMANRPGTWRTCEEAYATYLANPNFFAGIGYEFLANDPYVGVDFDDCIDEQGVLSRFARDYVPYTYTEISQSGRGIKSIARAKFEGGRRTAQLEIYGDRHFFALTGNILAGSPRAILSAQQDIDRIVELLGEQAPVPEGKPGSGKRAEKAEWITQQEWEDGRTERRKNINQLLHRLHSSAVSKKTRKDDTQLGYLLREDYRGFHEKWPHANIVRGDGTIDSSQVRAVMANSIKGRGFTFPQFAALMSYFFGVECASKWGTKQGVQQEFASLWFRGRSPRAGEYTIEKPAPVARGRASDHAALLEQAYQALLTFKAGTEALLTVQDLADAIGTHKRTASTLLKELTQARRICYRQAGQNSGIVVSFEVMIIEENENGDSEDNNALSNGTAHEPISATEELIITSGVHNEKISTGVLQHKHAEIQGTAPDAMSAEPHIYINNTNPVSLPHETIIPRFRVSLEQAVTEAFDTLPKDRTLEGTGERKKWAVTNSRVLEYVQAEYPGLWKRDAIAFWADKVRKRRKAATFEELKAMKREALEKKAASLRKRIEALERKAESAPMPEIQDWASKQVGRLEGQRALLAWELNRRDGADAVRIEQSGYSPGEQAEMLALVEREKGRAAAPTVSLPNQSNMAASLIANLQARKREQRE